MQVSLSATEDQAIPWAANDRALLQIPGCSAHGRAVRQWTASNKELSPKLNDYDKCNGELVETKVSSQSILNY